ncbi:MAG: hypothetical protein KGJ07_08050, partial [Patescibacteria group bacterium]|nr:hypothetical protein [Patescibacteria group bacterium]
QQGGAINITGGTGGVGVTSGGTGGIVTIQGGTGGGSTNGVGGDVDINGGTSGGGGIGNVAIDGSSVSLGLTNASNITFGGTQNPSFTFSGTGTLTLNNLKSCALITTNSSGVASCGTATAGNSPFKEVTTNGTIVPLNNTEDFLIGGTATQGANFAKFGFLNVAGGTPTASISAGVAGALTLNSSGTIATTAFQNLTIGGNTAGSLSLNTGVPAAGTGLSGFGITATSSNGASNTTNGQSGGSGGGLIFTTGTGGASTGSGSSANSGGAGGAITIQASNGGNASGSTGIDGGGAGGGITIAAGAGGTGSGGSTNLGGVGGSISIIGGNSSNTAGSITIDSGFHSTFNGADILIGTTNAGSIKFGNASNGTHFYIQSLTNCTGLQTSSAGEVTCLSFVPSPFKEVTGTNGGVIVPLNATEDFLVGGTSTSSADFAFINVAGGTPTASISAASGNNATYLTGAGSLATTNMQNLTIGGSTTGQVIVQGSNPNFVNALTVKQTSSGDGLKVDVGSVNTSGSTGILLNMPTAGNGSGFKITGAGFMGSGNAFTIDPSLSGSLTNFTGAYINISGGRTLTSASNISDTGNYLNLSRTETVNGSGLVYTVIGAVANLSSNCVVTSGGCMDKGHVLSLTQSYGLATGSVLSITNTGLGSGAAILTNSGGQAAVQINDTGNGDLLTASASGTTKFNVSNGGMLSLAGGLTSDIDTLSNTTLTIGATNATTISIGRSGQNITFPTFSTTGGLLYTNGSGVVNQLGTGSNGQCLISSGPGTSAGWGSCISGGAGLNNWWVLNSSTGTLSTLNQTLDVLIGGTGSTSAKIAFRNINSGTPVASISAFSGNNATYLNGTGT